MAHLPMRDMSYDVFFAGIRLNDLCYNYFQRVFAGVLKKAGTNDKDGRLHAYRHTFASRHVKNDTPIAVFAKLMNQSNIQQCNKECG
jgi:integrase